MQQPDEVQFVADSEALLIGAIMADPERVIPAVEGAMTEGDLARPHHRRLYRLALEIHEDGGLPDVAAIGAALLAEGAHQQGGGLAYVSELSYLGMSAALRVEYHLGNVLDASRRRRLAEAGRKIEALASPDVAIDEALDEAGRLVFEVATTQGRVETLRRVEAAEIKEVIRSRSSGERGVPTGFVDVDAKTFGFAPGDLVVVAGATGMGKTSFALQAACSAAEAGYPVALFSLEMTRDEVVWRMLCAEGMIDASRFRRDGPEGYPESNWRILEAGKRLRDLPIHLDDTPAIRLGHIRTRCRRLQAKEGLGLVVVDHLQIMHAEGENRTQALAEITSGLKALAKELGVPVMLLSQLSRFKDRADKRPTLSDLRESGAIEQDANTVLLLFRPEYYAGATDKEGNTLVGKAECIVAKQRNGATGIVDLFFRAECARFEDIERRRDG